jgi:pimeloyl-ACP methyl ester carboxylesterase
MKITVNNASLYCYTGGKAFDAAMPTVVMIHGVLNDHSVWILQSRYLANHGWNVLALDLPGHCRSGGAPATTVQEAADWVIALLDAAGVTKAALVGHSFGSLVALEAASRAPSRVSQLVLVGFAYPMHVSQVLIESSLNDPMKALEMVNVFSRSTLSPPPSALGPGTWIFGASTALGKHVLASNLEVNLFHTGFVACNSYCNGDAAIELVTCPTLFVLGILDQMTPPKAAKSMIAKSKNAKVVILPGGHHQMTETPEPMLKALVDFLTAK